MNLRTIARCGTEAAIMLALVVVIVTLLAGPQ